jgi:adenylate cyclase
VAHHTITMQAWFLLEANMGAAVQVPASILVVDDTQDVRDVLCARLAGHGYRVDTAPDGVVGLEKARAAPYDVILLDVMMPNLDGVAVLTALKQDPVTRYIPVVMISADTDHALVARCIALGAEDYLPKPFNGLLLRARVGACLVRKRWHDQEVRYLKLLEEERREADRLLLHVLPPPIADRVKRGERIIADRIPSATVMFADLVGFTVLASRVSPGELVALLSDVFSAFDVLVDRHGLYKVKTVGDAYMVAGGVPLPHVDHAGSVARLAVLMRDVLAGVSTPDQMPLQLRVGIHTGPLVAGVLGTVRMSYDVWGDTVNVASRMCSLASPGMIHLSDTTAQQLGSGFSVKLRGPMEVKGKGSMVTHILESAR